MLFCNQESKKTCKMDEEFFQEFFNKDKEIGLLKEQLYQVQNSNDIMRKTINNLINMKCKRGESSYLLNIALDTSLREHTQTLDIFVYIKDNESIIETISSYVLDLLIGMDKTKIPCCVLDNNYILYKSDQIDSYIVCTFDEFSEKVYECVSSSLIHRIQDEIDDDTNDKIITIINNILNKKHFFKSMKIIMKKYKLS